MDGTPSPCPPGSQSGDSVFTLCSSASKAEGNHIHLPLPQHRTSGVTHLCTSATAETVQYHLGSIKSSSSPNLTQQTRTLKWLLTCHMCSHLSLCVPFLNVYTQAGWRTKRGVGSRLQAPGSYTKLRVWVGPGQHPRAEDWLGDRPEAPEKDKDKDNNSSHHLRPFPGDCICT